MRRTGSPRPPASAARGPRGPVASAAEASLPTRLTRQPSIRIEPWWRESTDAHWRQWGFERRPPYQRVYERFVELEHKAIGAFRDAAHAIIGHVNHKRDSRRAESKRLISPKGSTETAKTIRQRLNEQPAPADDDQELGEKDRLYVGDVDDVGHDPDTGALRVRVGGHWYRLLDKTAGVRAYKTSGGKVKRFWVGFYNTKVVSGHFGAPVHVGVYSASTPEHQLYQPMITEAITACGGERPERVAADKGFSIESVFEWNTSRGISSVMPWRARGVTKRKDRDTHTRHGIPFCKHCGRPGRFVSFAQEKGGRLFYRCQTAACPQRVQSILCKTDYRLLVPLWRDTEAYMALKEINQQHERVHDDWRSHYGIGADSRAHTPKRRGAGWQQLRCYAALIVEWLKIAHLHGYLDGHRRNYQPVEVIRAESAVDRFRAQLRRLNLRSPAWHDERREQRRRRGRAAARGGGGPPPASPSGKRRANHQRSRRHRPARGRGP